MSDSTIPMTSTKADRGVWIVLGTSTECVIARPLDGGSGWVLWSNGQAVEFFPTKRAALQFCQNHPEL